MFLARCILACRLCNRVRTRLPDEAKADLDRTLARLQPIFDLSVGHPSDVGGEGEGEAESAGAGVPQQKQQGDGGVSCPPDPAALAQGHEVIEELAAAGCELADELVVAAAEHAALLLEAPADTPAPSPLTEAEGVGSGAAAVACAVPEAAPDTRPAAARVLRRLEAEGTKRLAEVCSLCQERLTALARSVSSWRQTG